MAKTAGVALKHPISLTPERAAKTTELHLPRIMAVEGYYACGLCHRCHQTMGAAEACLKTCVAKEPPRIPVRVRGERQLALCPVCAKGYGSEQDALLCLERCLESSDGLSTPVKEHGLRILAQARSPERFRGTGHSHRPLRTFVNQLPSAPPSRSAAPASTSPVSSVPRALDHGFDEEEPHHAPEKAPKPAPAATPIQQPMVEEKRTDGPFRKLGQPAFIRADARYECTCCHERYFTKMEVDNCFNSHPLEP